MDYIELTVNLSPREPFADVFISALGDDGFESFVETPLGFQAYIPKNAYQDGMEKACWAWKMDGVKIESSTKLIPRVNWNKEWEKNFESILVDNQVYIYAPFHEQKRDVPYQILIEPKMSFGTGHHSTTHLMIQYALELDFENKSVLDMGCGTGILAILAMMKKAKSCVAIDIDDWSIENTIENAERNNVPLVTRLGGVEQLGAEQFDIIFANINLNVLLADMADYANVLCTNGVILFSGFYEENLPALTAEAQKHGLALIKNNKRGDWMAAWFIKS